MQANRLQTFAYFAFFPLLIAFLGYVGLGYYIIVSNWFPGWSWAMATAACLPIVAVIYWCVRHTGFAIYEASTSHGWARYLWLPLFVVLFAISGLGFLTSSLLIVEGPDMAREARDALLFSVGALRRAANEYVDNSRYNDFHGRLKEQREALMLEIAAEGHCGIGPQASNILGVIEQLGVEYSVPFTRPSDAKDPLRCADKRNVDRYKARYTALLDSMDAGLRTRLGLDQRDSTKQQALEDIRPVDAAVDNLDGMLTGLHYFLNVSVYHSALQEIVEARGELRKAGALIPGFPVGDLGGDEFEHLGDLPSLAGVLGQRFAVMPAKTAGLCLLAVLFDGLSALIVANALSRHRKLMALQKEAEAAVKVGGKDVAYLWRPVPHPLNPKTGAR